MRLLAPQAKRSSLIKVPSLTFAIIAYAVGNVLLTILGPVIMAITYTPVTAGFIDLDQRHRASSGNAYVTRHGRDQQTPDAGHA